MALIPNESRFVELCNLPPAVFQKLNDPSGVENSKRIERIYFLMYEIWYIPSENLFNIDKFMLLLGSENNKYKCSLVEWIYFDYTWFARICLQNNWIIEEKQIDDNYEAMVLLATLNNTISINKISVDFKFYNNYLHLYRR